MNVKFSNLLNSIKNADFNFDAALSEWDTIRISLQNVDEPQANRAWTIMSVIETYKLYRLTHELLLNREYYQAWCKAEEVEMVIAAIKRNDNEFYQYVKEILIITHRLQSLYPYKLFASYELHIKEQKCSICGSIRKIRSICGHRVGYVYNGELCRNVVTQSELKGISLVTNPVYKYAVAFMKDDNDKDQYDYRILDGLMKGWTNPYQSWDYRMQRDGNHINMTFIMGSLI